MSQISRRHLLAGAAATAACADMPAIEAVEMAPVLEPITFPSHSTTMAWSQALKQAWELSIGPVDTIGPTPGAERLPGSGRQRRRKGADANLGFLHAQDY